MIRGDLGIRQLPCRPDNISWINVIAEIDEQEGKESERHICQLIEIKLPISSLIIHFQSHNIKAFWRVP